MKIAGSSLNPNCIKISQKSLRVLFHSPLQFVFLHLGKYLHVDLLALVQLCCSMIRGLCFPYGSLTHSKHISHVLCMPETRDIVCSRSLGSFFATTKIILSQEMSSGSLPQKKGNYTFWKM